MQKTAFLGLNEEQLGAVRDNNSRVLVNACAGSGKTATAAAWVAGLLEGGVEASSILMLTFTRKAAEEMRKRVCKIVGDEVRGLTAGTYHSVAIRLFRKEPGLFGVAGNFSICDDDMAEKIWKRGLKQLGGDPKESKIAASAHGLAVNLLKDPEKAIQDKLRTKVLGLAEYYKREKASNGLLDFDDILLKWKEALANREEVAVTLRNRWKYVMVDEIQDNSELQYSILRHLDPFKLFAVGDPNQCIYSFRGSAPSLMKRFTSDYSDGVSYTLTKNYRSGQNILDVANGATKDGESPIELKAALSTKGRVLYKVFGNPAEEGRGVCRSVAELLAGDEAPNEICVLFRSGFQSVQIEAELRRARIPYRKYGGNTIAEASDVKDFLALTRVLHNPADRISRVRVACLFTGVGEKTATREAEGLVPTWPAKASQAGDWIEQAGKLSWPEQAEFLYLKITPLILENYPDDGNERLERLRAIVSGAGASSDVSDFIDQFTLDPGEKEHPEGSIILSTVHSAKGLEWKHVFLMGTGANQMPSKRAVEMGETSEERRLFYVATTRARDTLVMSYSEIAPDGQFQSASTYTPNSAQWTQQRYY